ncbi:hypothetical protein DL769_003527 [Monosporascus sp. CRB-8-3]|nr:hypothetical protein DL769_003527 [Monosporascus sp. CRB-8-3]
MDSTFQPISYIPASQRDAIRDLKANSIWAVGHELLPQGGNHWCFYIQVGNGRSVSLDTVPSGWRGTVIPGGSKGNIIVGLQDFEAPTQAERISKLDIDDATSTVGCFLDVIVDAGRHHYEFTEAGSGCRQWTTDQIDLFYKHGLVASYHQVEQAKDDILTRWDNGRSLGEKYPLTAEIAPDRECDENVRNFEDKLHMHQKHVWQDRVKPPVTATA